VTAVVLLYGVGLALLFMVGCWFDREAKDLDDD
jgi:hypothetical protein